ncbi:MAG: DUF4474 domain-containing protein [Candidatus Ornithomonoglobus sp.]
MLTFIIIAAIVVFLIASGLIFFIRAKRFHPSPDKAQQLARLNDALRPAGFAYDYGKDYFYSTRNCWQREAGYCKLYDEGAPFFNMIMDCEPVTFSYAGKRWLIELWKGQYGITTGAEIGIYSTSREDIHSERFTGTFYEPVSDEEQLDMSFVLMKGRKKLLSRRARHWWLTAFKLGEFSEKDSLVMLATVKFPTQQMCDAFVGALIRIGYSREEFSVKRRTVKIKYTTPHSPQPVSQGGIQEGVVQQINKTNCKIYNFAAAEYTDTLDRLEYLKSFMPDIYDFMMHSLYGREFFKSFEWLINLVYGKEPSEPPRPSEYPCPSKPPCHPKTPRPSEHSQSVDDMCRQCRIRHCEQMIKENSRCSGRTDD